MVCRPEDQYYPPSIAPLPDVVRGIYGDGGPRLKKPKCGSSVLEAGFDKIEVWNKCASSVSARSTGTLEALLLLFTLVDACLRRT